MKSHKYWSLGALATMIGTFYTGYKDMKSAHKYFACSSLLSIIPFTDKSAILVSEKTLTITVSVFLKIVPLVLSVYSTSIWFVE